MRNSTAINLFEEVKGRINIVDVFNFYGVKVNSRNKAVCCFHNEKTPSLAIYPDTNSFYCFGCGSGGSSIDFVSKYYRLEPLDAARKIDNDFSLNLSSQELTPQQRAKYADETAKRKEDKRLVEAFKEWEREYFGYLCNNIRLLEELEEVSKPHIVDGVPYFPDDFGYAVNKKQLLEYHWEILFNGTLDDKISLYNEVYKAVKH